MSSVVLFRASLAEEKEVQVAEDYLSCIHSRLDVSPGDTVIGRYSVLPYYLELERDVQRRGGKLINSYREHRYVADLKNWYGDLQDLTSKTWFRLEDVPKDGGPFILKGETNSRKMNWNTHMFAQDFKEAVEVYSRLASDGLVCDQDIYIRQYVPLRKLMSSVVGPPVTEEYRFFCCRGEILTSAFYWSNYSEDLKEQGLYPTLPSCATHLVREVLTRIKESVTFVVVDVGILEDGRPIVVELNDGQMSGLSDNEPDDLYLGLRLWSRDE